MFHSKVFVVRDYAEKLTAIKGKTQNYSTLYTRSCYTKRKKKIEEGYIRCLALTTVITGYYPGKKKVGSSSHLFHRCAAGL